MRQPYVVPRRRLLFAVWLTALALPVLAIDNIPRTDARAASIHAVSTDAINVATTAASTLAVAAPLATTDVPSTTASDPTRPSTAGSAATTRPATTATPPVTAAPKPPPTRSTPTTPPTTAAPLNTETGGASWYDYNPGECAHLTIPKGTVVTVTSVGTGASVTCVVTDRGPHGSGRIIDLDRATFAQLGDPSEGVIQVRITW